MAFPDICPMELELNMYSWQTVAELQIRTQNYPVFTYLKTKVIDILQFIQDHVAS